MGPGGAGERHHEPERREAAERLADALLNADEHGVMPLGRPKVVIVSSAEIAEQGTLDANYWVDKRPGESWTAWKVRKQVEHLEEVAAWHDEQAAKNRAKADALREAGTT